MLPDQERPGGLGRPSGPPARELERVLRRVATEFMHGLPERLETLERAEEALALGRLTDAGMREVLLQAHRIRGLAAMVGYPRLSALSEDVEGAFNAAVTGGARRDRLLDVLAALVDEIQDTLDGVQ